MQERYMSSIEKIATSINEASRKHEFGQFQQLRSHLNGKKRVRSVIFDIKKKSVSEKYGWAYHTGGRDEIQFNIGFEEHEKRFRYGVAFSLEPSQSFISIDPLRPKIERFNEFVRVNAAKLADYRIWVWRKDKILKRDTAVREITEDEIEKPNFIFMGKFSSIEDVDIIGILDCFQDLLQLYCFVQAPLGQNGSLIESIKIDPPFLFQERLSFGEGSTVINNAQKSITVTLRSNEIKRRLCEILKNTATVKLGDEIPSGNGGRIDIVCLLPSGEHDFYEIKPAVLARHAIREGLPQLLEYAYRQGGHQARRLIIASQAPLDTVSSNFLSSLREKGLPIYYEHVSLD
jgi:hypothetical protein